ncbi:hypothetical protein [Anaeromyxobacter terrae]|uniref:hypothetical protein n=1 Tax=Anaeromyxobacter terrae TaxID=2925406 RepID=UPI001F59A399|nr:hypothetical protein [Anaeromyxobacter sp. SG22]
MKKLIVAAVLALTWLAPAVAQAREGGCSPLGSWSTQKPGEKIADLPWIGTTTGQSNSSGTVVTDIPMWPKDEVITWVAKVTMRGAWKRTGGNTFTFVQEGWVPGPDGTPILFARNVGSETLSEDCNTVTVVSTMQIFDAVTGAFIAEAPIEPPMVGYRIVVEGQ